MTPDVQGFFDERTNTITYLVSDAATRKAAIIDPVLDFDPADGRVWTQSADSVLEAVHAAGLDVQWIMETHAHADHLSAAQYLKEKTGAPVVIGAHIGKVQAVFKPVFAANDVMTDGRAFDRLFGERDTLMLGGIEMRALHTPGHTPACMTYLIGDAAFVGDTLFMPDFGTARTDFPGGNAATLYRSIQHILALPPQTRIFVGHDYLPQGRHAYAWETTVAAEKARNIHVHEGISEAEFVAMRQARDATLAAPRLILPSIQVNIRAGHMPPADDDGTVRLRLPVKMVS